MTLVTAIELAWYVTRQLKGTSIFLQACTYLEMITHRFKIPTGIIMSYDMAGYILCSKTHAMVTLWQNVETRSIRFDSSIYVKYACLQLVFAHI